MDENYVKSIVKQDTHECVCDGVKTVIEQMLHGR
jgi:hypothetical protein